MKTTKHIPRVFALSLFAFAFSPLGALASNWYLDAGNGDDSNDGRSWVTAKRTIQNAIDASADGDTLFVAPGTYTPIRTGNRPLRIESVQGPLVTKIDGNGETCADLSGENFKFSTNTVLVGFTCFNGGVPGDAAGIKSGTAERCIVRDCNGSGCGWGIVRDCLIVDNHGINGGGCIGSLAINCTIVGNTADHSGNGAYCCSLHNCILYDNEGGRDNNGAGVFNGVETSDELWKRLGYAEYKSAVFCGDPGFVDAANGDYRLAAGSPCIDAGDASIVTTGTDLAGGARIANGAVDLGAYEFGNADAWYVDAVNGDDSNDGRDWTTAKRTIQNAIDASADGDTILVAPGTYTPIQTGNRPLRIESVQGPLVTKIDGNGETCANLSGDNFKFSTNTVFVGFTCFNGGVPGDAAGIKSGTAERCIVRDCNGSGCGWGIVRDCLIVNNHGINGGGCIGSLAINCTIVGNTADHSGNGAYCCSLHNCILYGNEGGRDNNGAGVFNGVETSDELWKRLGYTEYKSAVFCGDPGFVDAANGDYRLAAGSPCIDAGDASVVTTGTDLTDNARIVNGVVDLGAYEFVGSVQRSYVVAFNANGGTGTMPAQTIDKDAAAKLERNTFTKKGFVFSGWAVSAAGSVAYTDGASVKNLTIPGKIVTLYAKWTAKRYAISLDRQGGSGGPGSVSATYGASMPAIAAPSRTGYTFGGYWTAANGGGVQYYTAAGTSARAWDRTSATTLYAKWTSATYIVKFVANGGTGKMSAQEMVYGKPANLAANKFMRKGWVFIGWATKKGGAVEYANKASVKDLEKAGKTVTLYARWAKKTYKVKFLANGGKGRMAAQKMTYGKSAKLKANKFKRKGYAFKGWAKSKALAKKGKVAYKNKKKVKNLVTTGKTVKLYAVWKRK